MTEWVTFAGLTGVVLVLLLGLSYLTQQAFDDAEGSLPPHRDGTIVDGSGRSPDDHHSSTADDRHPTRSPGDGRVDARDDGPFTAADDHEQTGSHGRGEPSPDSAPEAAVSPESESVTESELEARIGSPFEPNGKYENEARNPERGTRGHESIDPGQLSTGMLLANVALSQGLFAAVLLAAAFYTAVPADALGVEFSRTYLLTGLAVGSALGLGLYVANELGAATAKRVGIDHDEELRGMLAPDTVGGWLVLLLLVLPVIAVFEEFLFRAALIGALSVGFDVSPWLLAVVSSIAFAVGHGMQGPAGIVVTGALGFVLAAAFILTESLLVVIVAHYLVNAFEFVVHEGFGFEWGETTGS